MGELSALHAMEYMKLYGRANNARGQECREVLWYRQAIEYPFHSFKARPRDNLDYIKREFQWYLNADPYDDRICKYAKIWNTIKQPDNRIFSNYGHFWFGAQRGFEYVINTLKRDPQSRRAYLPMCSTEHTFLANKDMVCTKGITFRIVNAEVQMHVDMRSSDLFVGASIDWPCFTFLHEMVACTLSRPVGQFIFSADSLHVYDRNWHHVQAIIDDGEKGMYEIDYPEITDPYDLINQDYKTPFGQWLTEVQL